MKISTINNKAKNLIFLKNKGFNIPKLIIFNCKDFINKNELIINKIQKNFRDKIAIRSSAKNEDGLKFSNAGKYESFVNIDTKKKKLLKKKIEEVIKSYDDNDNIFFVQSMVQDISLSGVVLTRDLNDYTPYFTINYHKGTDSTLVTSGKKKTNSIKYFPNTKYKIDLKFRNLIEISIKLKKLYNCDIDIEFCINKNGRVFILQVRKLNIPNNIKKKYLDTNLFGNHLLSLEKKIIKLKKQQNNEFGNTTYFGVMPDWNPAEIIGKKPKPLALSLYRELITDHIWSENRYRYGFKNISQYHLMTTFYNTPFIDIKVDFNSWLPRNLDKKTQIKLINFYLNKFKRNKSLHDKIEREIIFSCYSVNLEKKINQDLNKIFTKFEINSFIKSLKKINNLAYKEKNKDLEKIKKLIIKQDKIEKSNLYFFDKIYWHVENCKKFGTLPFAGLARCGFIAIELIESFVKEKIFTAEEKNNFLASINTVSSDITKDHAKLTKRKFLEKYGHLRPNSYEITSLNYREGYKKFFRKKVGIIPKKKKFKFSKKQEKQILKFVRTFNKKISFNKFINFIKESIELREHSKFIFMRSIDLIFENLKNFAKKYDLSISDLAYLKINEVTDFYYNLNSNNTVKLIKQMIKYNKNEYQKSYYLDLPDIILEPKDLYVIKIPKENPNYITRRECEGNLVYLNINKKIDISNKIVCIENADPGFDFIFSHNIKGLITKYGGFNSHMSIRCSELGIPAIIGVGKSKFEEIINKDKIRINCRDKNFQVW
jgi:phosphohistidine swiveling domain-containing protein